MTQIYNDYYVENPDGTTSPVPDVIEWARQMTRLEASGGKLHLREFVGWIYVSTTFLGINHSFQPGAPMIYETMAFVGGPGNDILQERYSTRAEAEAGHRATVEFFRSRKRRVRAYASIVMRKLKYLWWDFQHRIKKEETPA